VAAYRLAAALCVARLHVRFLHCWLVMHVFVIVLPSPKSSVCASARASLHTLQSSALGLGHHHRPPDGGGVGCCL